MFDEPVSPTSQFAEERWPTIYRYLADGETGNWRWLDVSRNFPPGKLAAGHEEWADFHEWQLDQRAQELADDNVQRRLVAQWTEAMAYYNRRLAAWVMGEDPGEPIPPAKRRPDLYASRDVRVATTP